MHTNTVNNLFSPLEVYHIGESMKGRVVVSLTKDLAMKGRLVKLVLLKKIDYISQEDSSVLSRWVCSV